MIKIGKWNERKQFFKSLRIEEILFFLLLYIQIEKMLPLLPLLPYYFKKKIFSYDKW